MEQQIKKQEFEDFKKNIDGWIKQIREEYSGIIDYQQIVEENTENIQHNYELIHELKGEIDNLQESIIVIMDSLDDWKKEDKETHIRTAIYKKR